MSNENEWFNPKKTPITYLLVTINIVVYIVSEIIVNTRDGEFMLLAGAMNPYYVIFEGQWYRLLSCTFLHFGLEHLANNMLMLFTMGQILEKAVGHVRYVAIYLAAGIGGAFASMTYMMVIGENNISAGASGAIFGIVGAIVAVILVHKGKYEGITIKRALGMMILTLYYGFATTGVDNAAHIGGVIIGFILTCFIYGIPYLIKNRSRKIINHQDLLG